MSEGTLEVFGTRVRLPVGRYTIGYEQYFPNYQGTYEPNMRSWFFPRSMRGRLKNFCADVDRGLVVKGGEEIDVDIQPTGDVDIEQSYLKGELQTTIQVLDDTPRIVQEPVEAESAAPFFYEMYEETFAETCSKLYEPRMTSLLTKCYMNCILTGCSYDPEIMQSISEVLKAISPS